MDRGAVVKAIGASPVLSGLAIALRRGAEPDPAHDFEHLLRVAVWTCRILAAEAGCLSVVDGTKAIATALLHDLVGVPKDSEMRAGASALSAESASILLRQAGFPDDAVAEMGAAIRTHSFSRGERPEGILGMALQDADRLDALGAIGTLRCASVSARMGAALYNGADPWATDRRPDDRAFAIDHFRTKLLLLADAMNTSTGQREAVRRTRFLRLMLGELCREIGG